MRRELTRFAVAGTLGFIVDAGVLYIALWAGLGYYAGRAVSFLCAVWTTWQFNRRFTFTPSKSQSLLAEWGRYLVAMSAGGCANYASYSAVVTLLKPTSWLPLFAIAVGSIVGLMLNFVSAKWWVFKKTTVEPDR
ncbi:putative flippase GtrA [Trinickia symbiotica]|uniref:GtrA family protein n=1 Tax=Trinickia symbiotica TaxID=863227 RepID=A0A2N7X5T6_9BURK|nr:GtrA family protein [Trinickia symbiotica]PMS36931.1 GtrA family protein [Trinickia symbiotica]PPK41400.1 putative flippase GtrA [Trinickia symbiotica]